MIVLNNKKELITLFALFSKEGRVGYGFHSNIYLYPVY